MTRRESAFLSRLEARREVLAARLALTPKEASFRQEIEKEYNAMVWACEKLKGILEADTIE